MRHRYFARRLRFESGERISAVMCATSGMPVHEAVLFLNQHYRLQGKKAETIHAAACSLVLLFRHLDRKKLDLLARLRAGQFLTPTELDQLADLAQYNVLSSNSPPRRAPQRRCASPRPGGGRLACGY